jgi:hypothetical protein
MLLGLADLHCQSLLRIVPQNTGLPLVHVLVVVVHRLLQSPMARHEAVPNSSTLGTTFANDYGGQVKQLAEESLATCDVLGPSHEQTIESLLTPLEQDDVLVRREQAPRLPQHAPHLHHVHP